ncbi:MAG: RnfABCDGE type electron transport complex subunit D [Candidatus Anaerobiospirillum pullicola]|uniref:RnfABCDGE type electron transport complex subunit D n=1 Tax=Candidatus Anaerobiospirillum pullicola TaxID=2838451 RepID=A0A948WYK4_9GAMM|nr:RnfABCDGE type electron transport complex subunit D [Candidatus Anaerobiospirillum pullicola]
MQISVQSAKQNLGIEHAPHVHSSMTTTKIMLLVLISLLPAVGVMTYFFGAATIVQFVIAAVVAIVCQVLAALLRGRSLKRACQDPSGLVTALLLALTLPPLLPWYLTVIATAFAMLIVRECFGGLGMNIFNPAMSGFIFLVISVPGVFYTTWITPTPEALFRATPSRVCEVIFQGADPTILTAEIKDLNARQEAEYTIKLEQAWQEAARTHQQLTAPQEGATAQEDGQNAAATANAASTTDTASNADTASDTQQQPQAAQQSAAYLELSPIEPHITADALTGATFLESIKTARKAGNVDTQPKLDFMSPSFIAYACLAAAYFFGGMVLICTKVIRFQVPLFFLLTMMVIGALWHYFDPTLSISALEHLLMGGTMLGAFYIITDPVTTCGTFKGRILLSMIIAVLIIVIRVHGSYSDSVAFAVMLGNCLAPLMDVLTKRRPFGIGYRKGGLD